MKKRNLSFLLAGLMVFSSVFAGYSGKAEAADSYVTEADLADNQTQAPAPDEVVPDANQYEYQKQELAAFCHFGPNTFNEIEWGEHYGTQTPDQIFKLEADFDAETLVSTLKEAGFEKLIVTAKHHDGFCIWNSKWTDYDVESTSYAGYDYDGLKGDVLAEISAACTKYDMDMGLYLSPWDIHEPSYGIGDGDMDNYNEFYNNQLEEILSNPIYGNDGHFKEVWMDGAKGSGTSYQEYDFQRWFATIQKYEGKAANQIIRIAGGGRAETAYKVANALKAELRVDRFDAVIVATSKGFADALAGSYLAVEKNAPILLVNSEKEENVALLHTYIKENLKENGTVYILGGEKAVGKNVENIDGNYTVTRLGGGDRYVTNLKILEEADITGSELIVATGKTFADSLSASATKRPILLVKPGQTLNDEQKAFAQKVKGGKIYIVGGKDAVSKDYAEEFEAYGEVIRVAGETRQETSVKVAETFFPDAVTAVVASAGNYPDGLCGGPLAASINAPLVLTNDKNTTVVENYVDEKGFEAGTVLGGESALMEKSVEAVFGKESVDGDRVSYAYLADCMLFGSEAYTTVRWIGNEHGYANEQTWSKSLTDKAANTIDSNSGGGYTKGFRNGNQWTVPEADARITSGWFWGTTKNTPKTVAELAEMYFKSVGYNAPLLLNIPPNNQGTVDAAILERVEEFGTNVKETFQTNLAASAVVSATEVRGKDIAFSPANVLDGDDSTYWTVEDGTTSGTLLVDLGETTTFDVVSIEEAILFGQRITNFKVEYQLADGEWKVFDEGTTIGAKRLCREKAVKADKLRITVGTELQTGTFITSAANAVESGTVPMITNIGIYKASEGFEIASPAPDGMDIIDERDERFEFSSGWSNGSGSAFIIEGTEKWAGSGASFTVDFTGTKFYLVGTIDPVHGTANISIDGGSPIQIDTRGSARKTGQIIFTSDDLSDGEHTLTLNCTGTIGVDGAYVINNGGLGMIGIEEAQYTMNEDSELEVKLIRVGGTKEVTVNFAPNPGSAIQDDYDTEAIYDITFAEGETEKTAIVRTERNTNKTGDQYFTVDLSTKMENVILGFNSKARITILDEESIVAEPEPTATEFPTTVNETVTIEAETMELHNTGEGEAWPLQIGNKSWASGGQFVNAMNSGDSATLYYNAPVAGTYKVVVTYRSGDSANGFTWSEANNKITAGQVTMGASDGANATHTGEIEFEVVTAGAGALTFTAGIKNAPQIDKFDITLVEVK